MNIAPTIADAPCPRQLLLSDYGTTFVSSETRSFIITKLQASHSPKTAQIRKTTANLGKDGLVVRHVTIFGHGQGLQRAIINESQHRKPERLIMAQH